MLKNADMKQSKTVQHSFCHNTGKKVRNNTGQKPKYNINVCKKNVQEVTSKKLRKSAKFMHAGRKKTWSTETTTFSQQRNCRSKFLKTKKSTNQNIIPRGMLRGSLNLVIYDPVQKQAQTSKVIDLLNSEILIFKNF